MADVGVCSVMEQEPCGLFRRKACCYDCPDFGVCDGVCGSIRSGMVREKELCVFWEEWE